MANYRKPVNRTAISSSIDNNLIKNLDSLQAHLKDRLGVEVNKSKLYDQALTLLFEKHEKESGFKFERE